MARLGWFLLALLALPLISSGGADARGGIGRENPWAADHLTDLPRDIRSSITSQYPSCEPARAKHGFARYLITPGAHPDFVALHFELFGCSDRTAICTSTGCLHQVYAATRAGYRLVYSGHVDNVELRLVGGRPAIALSCTGLPGTCRTLVWNGRRFR